MDVTLRSLQAIEWPQLLAHYSSCCRSNPAKELAKQLQPPLRRSEAELKAAETRDALKLISSVELGMLRNIESIEPTFLRLRKSSVLSGEEFCQIVALLQATEELLAIYKKNKNLLELEKYFKFLKALPETKKAVLKAIDEDGKIKPSASSTLKELHSKEKKLHGQIQEKLQKVLQEAQSSGALQDNFYDVRDGRYVIPIIKDHKGKIPGIIYESSGSTATVFIEPKSIRDWNDQLRQVNIEIDEEQYRILRSLTDRIRPDVNSLQDNFQYIVDFDLVVGRAELAKKLSESGSVCEPVFANYFSLQDFYHPLLAFILKKEEIVTTSVILKREQQALVISGPNTGGKTVLLKAIGLCSTMARCGFYVPGKSGSTIAWFENVLAYIGDEQSIEKSLSSFSSSIIATKQILQAANKNSLVLIDEIFSSTDPNEAVALALSVIKYLNEIGATTIVTTHLSGLKAASAENVSLLNACMQFNAESLSPTYKLQIGVPGRSRAIETAERYGLPKNILDHAKSLIDPEILKLEDLLAKIEEKERLLDEDREKIDQEIADIENIKNELNRNKAKLDLERANYKDTLREEMKKVEAKAMEKLEATIAEYREKLKKAQFQPEEFAKAKKVVQQAKKSFKVKEVEPPKLTAEEIKSNRAMLKVNGSVYLYHLDKEGTLITDPGSSAKEAEVQVGILKIKVPWENIQPSKKDAAPLANVYRPVVSSAHEKDFFDELCEPELMLLGVRKDEVYERLTHYLDKAIRSGRPSVRIVHGVGSGTIKKAVLEILKNGPYNLPYRQAEKGEGGDGCTVVLLDDV